MATGAFLVISDQNKLFFLQNGCWPFWVSEIYFRLHFLPFQIKTQLQFFVKTFWLAKINFGYPKVSFISISHHFRSILGHQVN
jgi:hypothetical protein